MKHILPTAIWELFVGEFNPGTGMAAVHLGSDHHKACLKLSAWVKQNSPDWPFCCEGFCKQHASGLCISPLSHVWKYRRAMKVLAYLEDAMNRACLLAWLIIVSSVMRLRYSLFKHAQMTPPPGLSAEFDLRVCMILPNPLSGKCWAS